MLLTLMMATSLCGTLSYAETVSGLVVYDGVSETYTKVDERLSIGKNADADIKLLNGAVYDMSTTKKELELGSSSTHGNLTIIDSQYYGSGRNVWVYNSDISVSGENSKLQFCVGETAGQNYRVLLGISGSTVNIDLTNGASFESSASQFVACYGSGTTVNINVDSSTFTQTALTQNPTTYPIGSTGVWVEKSKETDALLAEYKREDGWYDVDSTGGGSSAKAPGDTITYICDSGTDKSGWKYGSVSNCTTNISVINRGVMDIQSTLTYVGSFLDSIQGASNKSANFVIDDTSSVSFKRMAIYADTNIKNGGKFNATDVIVYDGAKLSYSLIDGCDEALFDADTLTIKSGAVLEFSLAEALDTVSPLNMVMDTLSVTTSALLDANLVIEEGAIVAIDGINLDLNGNDLSIADGAIFNIEGLTAEGNDGLFTLFSNVGSFDGEETILVTINGQQAAVTYDGTNVVAGVVPEPTTATLSLLALATLAARRRRK